MTLMEIMVVVFIVALIMTGMALGIGNLTHQRLKSSAVSVAAAVRAAYSRAATTGHTVRIVFDIDAGTFWTEEAEAGRVLLDREDRGDEEEEEEEEGEEGAGTGSGSGTGPGSPLDLGALGGGDPLAALMGGGDAEQMLEAAKGAVREDLGKSLDLDVLGQLSSAGLAATSDLETPRYRRPRFGAAPGKQGQVTTLNKGVTFVSVYTSHRDRPAEEGKAYLYFFSGGMTELAVIQLQDGAGYVNSVEVHPLTGRCRMHNVPYEPPMREEDQNEAAEAL
jgi:general secretion pathway protein H